jgi:serine/alanine adding enzyme
MDVASTRDVATPWSIIVRDQPGPDWDVFVSSSPDASVYFLSGWTLLAKKAFGHRCWFIEARDSQNQLIGVLPVVQQKSLLGNFATSVAFFNNGGSLSADDAVAVALMEKAKALATDSGCSYLELRDNRQRACEWSVRTDKVSMVRPLPASFAELSQQLGSKLRSQAKRADREAPTVQTGSAELIDDFYAVFASNMRDLGTPVYPKSFFARVIAEFPEYCRVIVVASHGKPVAAGFLVLYKGVAEIPWASCLAEAKPLGFNMKLYWEVLQYVVQQGCTSFDFGRSTADAGTYKFKKQWGAEPVQLYWYRWERNAANVPSNDSAPEGHGKLMQYASAAWQRLPLPIANFLGPLISPGLPW